MNWKHDFSNLKPYEIVVSWRAPVLGLDSPDSPAGQNSTWARLIRRKWKVWYHVDNEYKPTTVIATYVRAWRTNDWILSSGDSPLQEVNYDNHEFLWKKKIEITQTIFGWDVSSINFTSTIEATIFHTIGSWVTLLPNIYADLIALQTAMQANIFDLQYPWYTINIITNLWHSYFTITGSGTFPINGFQLWLLDLSSGIYIIWPNADATNITFNTWNSFWTTEIVKMTEKVFVNATDKALFIKPKIDYIYSWKPKWWSYPENNQWWTVPSFTAWSYEMNLFFETDWIVSWIHINPTYYNTFRDIIDTINTNFSINWSSFRVINSWNNRILVTDNQFNILEWWNSYFSNNNYVTIQIEIFSFNDAAYLILPNSDAKDMGVDNIEIIKQLSWLHYWYLPSSNWSSWQLPTPKIRLEKPRFPKSIEYMHDNVVAWNYKLYWYPEVVTQDIPDSLIAQWVRLAFGYYRLSKTWQKRSRHKKYARPSHWVNWQALSGATRWGWHFFNLDPLAWDRPSKRDVVSNGQVIPFWEWLHNRFTDNIACKYRDAGWLIHPLTIIWPRRAQRRQQATQDSPSSKYFNTSHYSPFRIVCRYEYQIAPWKWIAWPISDKLCIVYKVPPFSRNDISSVSIGKECCDINLLRNPSEFIAYIEKSKI